MARTKIRKLLAMRLLCGALLLGGSAFPAAAEYPDRPVRLIVPFTAGGSPDTTARRVAQRLTQELKQQFVVENRGGAAGNIGAEAAARSTPDGYTLMMMANSHVINPALYSKLTYDVLKDFTPICLVVRGGSMMVVPASSPAKTVAEFVALAKANPGKLNFGSGGAGSPAHLSAEAFRQATGIDYVHVPYKGAPEIVRALLSDQVQVGFPTFDTALGQVQQKSLRALASTGSKRSRLLPDTPTLLEALPNGFALEGWLGIVAPAGTPPEVEKAIVGAMTNALKDPVFREQLESVGSDVDFLPGPVFGAMLPGELVKWRKLVESVGARVE
ncbi:MAG: tripartite tricarboxylate transporter substrate binding protein [Proteobacteria bacterium]|nr:tripartite tricarboxylate transporter substrate binding protein [Pseudomonadota bacterium]